MTETSVSKVTLLYRTDVVPVSNRQGRSFRMETGTTFLPAAEKFEKPNLVAYLERNEIVLPSSTEISHVLTDFIDTSSTDRAPLRPTFGTRGEGASCCF